MFLICLRCENIVDLRKLFRISLHNFPSPSEERIFMRFSIMNEWDSNIINESLNFNG